MKIITITNQKGGVGKTMLTYHLANQFAKIGKVLCVDIDPQGNLTDYFLGENILQDKNNVIQLFEKKAPVPLEISESLHLIGSDIQLSSKDSKTDLSYYFALQKFCKRLSDYDFIFIDTPPNLGLFTMNSMLAANCLLVPLDSSKDSIKGLNALMRDFKEIKEEHNPELSVLGMILNTFDGRTNADRRTKEQVESIFPGMLFKTEIPRSTTVRDARNLNLPVYEQNLKNPVSLALATLFDEIIDRLSSL
jgi:chromosome partitioning protein